MENNNNPLYGKLASLYYDTKEQYAPQDEVDFYAGFIRPGDTVLEAMSGSGRLQIPLLQAGYRVDGVDNSPHMLERCRRRAASLNLTPILYEQSLENLNLDGAYDMCIIAMGSFQLIADRALALQALQKIHAYLKNNGTLLFDIFVPHTMSDASRVTDNVRIDAQQLITCSTRYFFDPTQKLVDAVCSYERILNGQIQEREDELMVFTWYEDKELAQLLDQADFDLVTIHEQSFRTAGSSRTVQATARTI